MKASDTHGECIAHEGYRFRMFRSEEEITWAELLLHEVYIQEEGWDFPSKTPSGIRQIETDCGNLPLTDNLAGMAYWFGAFREAELIGCIRVLEHPNTEFNRYREPPRWLSEMRPLEMNRLAIHENHRNHRFLPLMLMCVR